jgi:hypothetical protein
VSKVQRLVFSDLKVLIVISIMAWEVYKFLYMKRLVTFYHMLKWYVQLF